MWHDRDPYREQQHIPDTFWLVVAALLFAACGLVWLIGQVAAIVFGAHQHLPVRLVDMLGVLLRLPGTWDDPARRGPDTSRCSPARWHVRRGRPPFWIPALPRTAPGFPPWPAAGASALHLFRCGSAAAARA